MIRRVCGSGPDAYRLWPGLSAGTVSRLRSSASSPLGVIVRHCTGQMSMQASHSMHRFAVNTVCTSQLRQRSHLARRLLRVEAQLDLDVEL